MERMDAAAAMFGRASQGNDSGPARSLSGRGLPDEETPWPAPPTSAPPARFSPGRALMRDGDEEPPAAPPTGRAIRTDEPSRFADMLVQADAEAVQDFVEAACADGVSLEAIYLDLIVPAAVELGRAWEDDRYMFSDVTVGMVRLSQVLWNIGPRFRRELECPRIGRSVLPCRPGASNMPWGSRWWPTSSPAPAGTSRPPHFAATRRFILRAGSRST